MVKKRVDRKDPVHVCYVKEKQIFSLRFELFAVNVGGGIDCNACKVCANENYNRLIPTVHTLYKVKEKKTLCIISD